MLTDDLLAFVRGSLPPPPLRVLEVGAGDGELAVALSEAGYAVIAIDPTAEPGGHVQPIPLLEATGEFDAAVSVVALHHVEPLEESCAHLARLVAPGGTLVIDELDIRAYDERATTWWLSQRRAMGHVEEHRHSANILEQMAHHIAPLTQVRAALLPYFDLGHPVRGPYLHRWELSPHLLGAETELIAAGRLPAVGARLVGTRRAPAQA